MITIEQVDGKLNQILSRLNDIEKAVASGTHVVVGTVVNGAAAVPAYELPALPVEQVTVDEQTVNRDGSVWVWSTGFSPVAPGPGGNPRVPVQQYYGYISPTKCPRLWELAHKVLGPQSFTEWHADWEQHKYGIYASNPADTNNTPIDELAKTVNFMMFYFRVHRVRDWVQ